MGRREEMVVQSTKMPGLGVRTAEGQGLSILRCFWSQKLPHSLPRRENKPCMSQRAGVGAASTPARLGKVCPSTTRTVIVSPPPPSASQNSLDPHRHAINSGINSSRGKLFPGARTCSHLSGNSFAQACLCFLPSTFLGPAGPGQARDIPPSA